jgi:hypothetical protein
MRAVVPALLVAANSSAAWGAAAFAVAAVLALALTALLLVPRLRGAEAVADAAEALAAGHFGPPVEPPPGELAPVAAAINAAGTRIGRELGALRDERAQLLALLNASSDATVAVDASGTVV